jgi:hypothetical protein
MPPRRRQPRSSRERARRRDVEAFLEAAHASSTFRAAGLEPVRQPSLRKARTRPRRERDDRIAHLSLLQDEHGVLRWQADTGPPAVARRARAARPAAVLVEHYRFEMVQGSQVASFLDGLDTSFNPVRGFRRWTNDGFDAEPAVPINTGRILLMVHGTFSRGDVLFEALHSSSQGATLLQNAARRYDQILSFEHPTMSVSPILNALDLARAFSSTRADVDVICHSRGGLVVRWWLEALNTNARLRPRVVFVASPLQGTSLASPLRLRAALGLMTNVVVLLKRAGQLVSLAIPLFGVIAGLMKILGSVTGAMGRTPLLDVAVAMIPGLSAMSRRGLAGSTMIAGNFELERLGAGLTSVPKEYCVVKSNFEPTDPGWAFWRYFVKRSKRLQDLGADVVFTEHNDLVVDTASMDVLSDSLTVSEAASVLDFGTTAVVHHLNYFAQPQTASFIAKCLMLE